MAQTLTFRTDEDTRRALAELTADGTNPSQAIRAAVIDTAARRSRGRLRLEVAALAADPEDRRATAQVLRDMESLDAW